MLSELDVKSITGEFSLSVVARLNAPSLNLKDVSVLTKCPNLFYLNLTDNNLIDFTFLKALNKLRVLILDNISTIKNLSMLDSVDYLLPELEYLSLRSSSLNLVDVKETHTFINIIAKIAPNITTLNILNNPIVIEDSRIKDTTIEHPPERVRHILSLFPKIRILDGLVLRDADENLINWESYLETSETLKKELEAFKTEKDEEYIKILAKAKKPEIENGIVLEQWIPKEKLKPVEIPIFDEYCEDLERKVKEEIMNCELLCEQYLAEVKR